MLTPNDIIIRLLLGTLLGGIIGFERQAHGRPAGFRTQLLVCVACTLLMLISQYYYDQLPSGDVNFRVDPTRIAAGAMTGVGFLGAGVILKTGMSVHGLTTAACIWIVSAIGLAVGAGMYVAGLIGFVITFFSLWTLRIFEDTIPRLIYRHVSIVTGEMGDDEQIVALFTHYGLKVTKMDYDIDISNKERTLNLTLTTKNTISWKELISDLSILPSMKKISIVS